MPSKQRGGKCTTAGDPDCTETPTGFKCDKSSAKLDTLEKQLNKDFDETVRTILAGKVSWEDDVDVMMHSLRNIQNIDEESLKAFVSQYGGGATIGTKRGGKKKGGAPRDVARIFLITVIHVSLFFGWIFTLAYLSDQYNAFCQPIVKPTSFMGMFSRAWSSQPAPIWVQFCSYASVKHQSLLNNTTFLTENYLAILTLLVLSLFSQYEGPFSTVIRNISQVLGSSNPQFGTAVSVIRAIGSVNSNVSNAIVNAMLPSSLQREGTPQQAPAPGPQQGNTLDALAELAGLILGDSTETRRQGPSGEDEGGGEDEGEGGSGDEGQYGGSSKKRPQPKKKTAMSRGRAQSKPVARSQSQSRGRGPSQARKQPARSRSRPLTTKASRGRGRGRR